MSDIQVGVTVIDYQLRLSLIMAKLQSASQHAHTAAGYLPLESGFYDGEARAEMKLFFDAFAANVDKLVGLTSAAAGYLVKVMETFSEEDKKLAAQVWAEGVAGGGVR